MPTTPNSTYTILHYVEPGSDELEHAGEAPGTDERTALEAFNRDVCGNAGDIYDAPVPAPGPSPRLTYAGTTFVAVAKQADHGTTTWAPDADEHGERGPSFFADSQTDAAALMADLPTAELTTAQLEQSARIIAAQITPRMLMFAAEGALGPNGTPHERRIYRRALELQNESLHPSAATDLGSGAAADLVAILEAVEGAWFATYQGELCLDNGDNDNIDTSTLGDLALNLFSSALDEYPDISLQDGADRVASALAAILNLHDDSDEQTLVALPENADAHLREMNDLADRIIAINDRFAQTGAGRYPPLARELAELVVNYEPMVRV